MENYITGMLSSYCRWILDYYNAAIHCYRGLGMESAYKCRFYILHLFGGILLRRKMKKEGILIGTDLIWSINESGFSALGGG